MYHNSAQSHVPVPPLLTWDLGRVSRRLLPLQRLSYQPQRLLQRTKEFFEREELLDKCQIRARSSFFHTFTAVEPKFGPYPTESQLWSLIQSLDAFFFSGLLTREDDPIIRLEFGENIFGQIEKFVKSGRLTLGRTDGEFKDGDAPTLRLRIRVEACSPWSREGHIARRDLISLLETVVHEMAHAYYISFTCVCGPCQKEMGAKGHGPAWQELKEVMYMTIRGWDSSLWDFYADDRDLLDGP